MAQTYLFEHGIEDPRAGLGFIRVPLTARQIAIVNEACLDYVTPADIVVAGIQALEAIAAAHAYAAEAEVTTGAEVGLPIGARVNEEGLIEVDSTGWKWTKPTEDAEVIA